MDSEFIVVLKGYDDTFSQDVNSIRSYRHEEIVWGARFVPMYETNNENVVELDFAKLSTFERTPI
jgi:inward rectifier potassium channel